MSEGTGGSAFWGLGLLSVKEMMESAEKLGLTMRVTFLVDAFLSERLEADEGLVLLFAGHYYLRFIDGAKHVIFDSGGFDHCRAHLALTDTQKLLLSKFEVNEKRYQYPGTDICGQMCLFVLFLKRLYRWGIMQRVDFFFSDIDANVFLMSYFTIRKEIGEEFDENDHRYVRFHAMRKLL